MTFTFDFPQIWLLEKLLFIRPEDIGQLEEFPNEVFLTEKTSRLPLDRVTGRVWLKFVDSKKESAESLDLEDQGYQEKRGTEDPQDQRACLV